MVETLERVYTPEEYLELEEEAETKHEFINGRIVAMAGTSREHNLIAFNLAGELKPCVKKRRCEAVIADMRVKVHATGEYVYPDLAIACGEARYEQTRSGRTVNLLNPTVVIEILSPSTQRKDRGEKLDNYLRLASVEEVLLVSQDTPRVEHYVRGEDGWTSRVINGLEAVLEIPSIGCRVAFRDIYDQVFS